MRNHTSNNSDYQTGAELVRNGGYTVCRALRREDRKPVLLKTAIGPGTPDTGPHCLALEYELLRELPQDLVLRPLGLERIDGRIVLVLDDPGGAYLADRLETHAMELPGFLELALAISETLDGIHLAGVVHRGIQPACIYLELPSFKAHLAGFERATRLPRASQRVVSGSIGDGSLAYLAPEQSGRMNRPVDSRSDLYSLGVVLFRMVTGRLPFQSDDPLELVHCHIAQQPEPPSLVTHSVPAVVSDILMKLLAKRAEDRYRSAAGLAADLHRCLECLHRLGRIDAFPLGEADPVERLEIPERLYGRDLELAQLLAAFQRVRSGGSELVTVAGCAGIGKTSMVLEVQKPILQARGWFAAGKFEQLTRDEPYGALIQSLADLVRQLLAESDLVIAAWRERLAQALGAAAGVMVGVVPDLELILGPQPVVPELDPVESRHRLELHFRRFIGALARRDHPLVLFLDDLQWADSASLGLLSALLASAETESFLLIGAYRDNEVDSRHPLSLALEDMRQGGAALSEYRLEPLQAAQLEAMLTDTFGCGAERLQPLTRLVQEKTLGNPFFARTLLDTAFRNGLIRHQRPDGWTWDTQEIRRTQPADNVVELLAARIRQLPEEIRGILDLAACVGNRFGPVTLATVRGTDPETIRKLLLPPMQEGLIKAGQQELYAFCHDRIQEAVYRGIAPAERARLHWRIGILLLEQAPAEGPGERLFEIADQLNQARSLLRGRGERERLARLDLQAGKRARRSAAFRAALTYFDNGIQALGRRLWSEVYELAHALYLGRAECAYLCGELEAAEADTVRLLRQARSALERAQVYRLRMTQYENTARFAAAVTAGKTALALFGIRFPKGARATQAACGEAMERIRRRIGRRSVADLADLRPMGDPQLRMAMGLLTTLWAPAYITGDKPLTELIAAHMVELSLVHGNTEESAYGYITHAITLGAVFGDYAAAYEFGHLALEVNRRFDDIGARAKVNHMFSCYIGFWRRPIAESFPYSREAYRAGLESGDLVYAAYGCFHESWHALFSGWELERFHRHYREKLGFLEHAKNSSFYDAHQLMLHWGLALQGRTQEPGGLSAEGFDENTYLERYRQVEFFTAFHHIARLGLLYTFGDYAGARAMARQAQRVAPGVRGMIWDAWLCLYSALSLTAPVPGHLSRAERRRLVASIDRMGRWAQNSPRNFTHQHHLLLAERARMDGRVADAIENYEAAIVGAADAGFIHHQALAKELYAEFWLARGTQRLARLHLSDALADYARWGAAGKVRQLAGRHTELVGETARRHLPEASTEAQETDALDTGALIEATRALSGEMDSGRLVDILLRLLLQNSGAQRAVLFGTDTGRLVPQMDATFDSGGVAVRRPAGGGWESRVAAKAVNTVHHSLRTLVIGDARRDAHLAADPYVIEQHAKSILCVPLLNQSVLEGIVYLENSLLTDAFTPARLGMVETLATQAAVSLKNGRLFESTRLEARRRDKAEQRLREVAEGTAAAVGEGFFRELVLHLAQAMGVRVAFVTECADAQRTRVRSLAFVDRGRFLDEVEYALVGTPCNEVIGGDISFYPDRLEQCFPKEKGLASYLGVPLHDSAGDVLGHLAVADDKPMVKSPDDESLLRIFAVRAGAELERQRAQTAAEYSQRVLADRQRLASIGEFASMIAHEIRSPLSTIGMALDYLHGGTLPDRATKRLDLARTEKQRLQSLLSEMLLFAKPQQLTIETLDLGALVCEVVDGQEGEDSGQERRRIEYRGPAQAVPVSGDRDKLKQVVINLISNACQAVTAEQGVTVALRTDAGGTTVRLQVRNPGHIPAEILARLAEPFFTTKARGTGLGLAIVKRIVDAHSGQLEIRSNRDTGVCVTVVFPGVVTG